MSKRIVLPREGYSTEIVISDSVAHSRRIGDCRPVMERNKELRKNKGAVRDWSFGRLALDIPETHMPMLNKFFPGLADPAHPDHRFQLRAFMKSPASIPYRVEQGSRTNAGHIICN